jgi:hypothetical protein
VNLGAWDTAAPEEKESANPKPLDPKAKPLDPKAKPLDPKEAAKAKTEETRKKLSSLNDQLAKAKAAGDEEAMARLKKEIDKLKPPAPPKEKEAPTGEAGATAEAGGGGAPAAEAGGGAPAAQGGGAPMSGGAPAAQGGGAPMSGGPQETLAPDTGAGQKASKEEVNQFINFAAQAYGVNPGVLSEIARLESNFNTGDIENKTDSNARAGTPSKGMFQFIKTTAAEMMPKAKAANPKAWEGVEMSWTNWKAQALTCAWGLSAGRGKEWSTHGRAVANAGGGGAKGAA